MTQTAEITATLGRYASLIEQTIRAELATDLDEWMQGALRYHFGWVDAQFQPITNGNSGKKLRPVMALLAYQGALEILQPGTGESADLEPALPLVALQRFGDVAPAGDVLLVLLVGLGEDMPA